VSPTGVTTRGAPGAPAPERGGRSRPWLRAAIVVAALAFLALLAYGVVSKAPVGTIDERLSRGQPAPAPGFDLPVLEAGTGASRAVEAAAAAGRLSLDELRGSPVVLNFWASWCEPCRAEAATLEEAWRQGRGDGLVVLGLNTQDLSGDAREFLEEFDTTYPTLRDESSAVAKAWGTTGLPETYFLGPDGRVVGHTVGAVSPQQLEAGVEAAREGRPIRPIEGGERRSVR
jgi:cytochrome c biogenesis protein CcmG/thiol:disulfide interchange protein DsbE